MNKVFMRGRLTKNANLMYSEKGIAVTKGTIAVPDGYGENRRTDFFQFTCFCRTAEVVAQYTKKGSNVFLIGKMKNDHYEKEGTKYYNHTIVVDEFIFLDKRETPENADEELAKILDVE